MNMMANDVPAFQRAATCESLGSCLSDIEDRDGSTMVSFSTGTGNPEIKSKRSCWGTATTATSLGKFSTGTGESEIKTKRSFWGTATTATSLGRLSLFNREEAEETLLEGDSTSGQSTEAKLPTTFSRDDFWGAVHFTVPESDSEQTAALAKEESRKTDLLPLPQFFKSKATNSCEGGCAAEPTHDHTLDSLTNNFVKVGSPAVQKTEVGSPLEMSVGSANHHVGTCKPCAYHHRAEGCQNGFACQFCHLCPPGANANRKREKKKLVKQVKRVERCMRETIEAAAAMPQATFPLGDNFKSYAQSLASISQMAPRPAPPRRTHQKSTHRKRRSSGHAAQNPPQMPSVPIELYTMAQPYPSAMTPYPSYEQAAYPYPYCASGSY